MTCLIYPRQLWERLPKKPMGRVEFCCGRWGGLWCLCVVSDPKWIFFFFHETPEQQLFNCQALRKLSIPDNDLSSLPTSIASLVNLRELDISKNGEGSKPRGSQGIGSCNEVLPPCDGEIRAPSQVSRLALWGRIPGNPPLFFP